MDVDPLLPPSSPSILPTNLNRPISRSSSSRWSAAIFIIGVEMAERFAYYAVSANLVMYMTGPLGEPTAAAAIRFNTWDGFALMSPLLGGFVADSFLGRYRTIVAASLFYILGLGMLTLSSMLLNVWPNFQVILFYVSLYMIALAQGFHKPCVQAFGADQFDQNDPQERADRSSFFNWWFFGVTIGSIISFVISTYVQDRISWVIGFGMPCFIMMIALAVFMMGSKTYRHRQLEGALFTPAMSNGDRSCGSGQSDTSLFVGAGDAESTHSSAESKIKTEIDAASTSLYKYMREFFHLIPIWATSLTYGITMAQVLTFFTKQGSTMNKHMIPFSSFEVPPAALQSFICISLLIFIPIYDRILVRAFRHITLLKRIGIGFFLGILSMVIAALVEIRRLKTARDFGLVDQPDAIIPMNLWWLVPQYALLGASEVFAMIGLQEFFYDQVPDYFRSFGIALYLSIFGTGNFISGFIVSVIDTVTKKNGESWFANNLNRARLDEFYWVIAGLNCLGSVLFLFSAQNYVYRKKANCDM